MFAYLSPFYEASVCPRNAPRPICHGLLLFGSSSRCLEVELCCALASEKYVLSFLFSSFCSVYLHMFLDGKTMRLGGKVLRTREVRNRIEKKKVETVILSYCRLKSGFSSLGCLFFFFFWIRLLNYIKLSLLDCALKDKFTQKIQLCVLSHVDRKSGNKNNNKNIENNQTKT